MKLLFFLFALFIVNVLHSQSPCPADTFDFTITGDSTTCVYTFTPDTTLTHKHICSISWEIKSHGTYGVACDPDQIVADPLTYSFCFDGYYDVTMFVHFCDGSVCYVTHTIYIRCLGATTCDPDSDRITSIPNPFVEITYLQPDTCDFNSNRTVPGCMFSAKGSGFYYIACGWKWAIRVPPGNCNDFIYYVQYDSITSCGNYTCTTRYLDTNIICIDAYIGRTIYIVATANSCCLPIGYQRGYYWTPVPNCSCYNSGCTCYTTIVDPTPTVSTYCSAYRHCDDYTYCATNPIEMDKTTGWPITHCFGNGKRIEQRDFTNSYKSLINDQEVTIYDINGIIVFKGKWTFLDLNSQGLKWPRQITNGIYFIKLESNKFIKLLKLN